LELIQLLPQCLENKLPAGVSVGSCTVLETSGAGSLETFKQLGFDKKAQHHVWIHLGVDASARFLCLESTAYNEASFVGADQRGWAPIKELIIKEAPASYQCRLPIEKLVSELSLFGYPVRLSIDPGRFVCNWIYFHSLHRSIEEKFVSLFVHVPPFSNLERDQQLLFITDLIITISSTLFKKDDEKKKKREVEGEEAEEVKVEVENEDGVPVAEEVVAEEAGEKLKAKLKKNKPKSKLKLKRKEKVG